MSTRISIIPDQFALGPLLCLVPHAKELPTNDSSQAPLSHLRTLEVALFSRLELLEKSLDNNLQSDSQSRLQIDRERQMLKQILDWCSSSVED